MNVLTALPWRRPLPCRPPRGGRDLATPAEGDAGCGWFESSHDLARGLTVCEHAGPAAVPGDALPPADWLALQLADRRVSSGRHEPPRGKASSGLRPRVSGANE